MGANIAFAKWFLYTLGHGNKYVVWRDRISPTLNQNVVPKFARRALLFMRAFKKYHHAYKNPLISGVGEGTSGTSMEVPAVGTPKLSGHQ